MLLQSLRKNRSAREASKQSMHNQTGTISAREIGRAAWQLVVLLVGAAAIAQAAPDDWSRFRGPNGSGVAETKRLPAEIGPEKNVEWKTPLPAGHSSPILSGNRIFLTAADGEELLTISLDRKTGKILWQREAPRQRSEKLHPRNNPASPSPAVDGKRVFVFFPDFGLLAYDFAGKELWRLPLGPFNNIYGMGASPIVIGDRVILVCDQSTNSFILAVGASDGRVQWKVDRAEAKSGHSTPIVYRPAGGGTQLLAPGSFLLTAYDVASGKKLWWVSGLSFEMKSTPVMDGETIYVNGYGSPENDPGSQVQVPAFETVLGRYDADKDQKLARSEVASDERLKSFFPFIDLAGDGVLDAGDWTYYGAAMATTNGMLAIRLGGSGDMSKSNLRWRYHRAVPQLPSPLLYEGVLYMVNDGGIVTSLRPRSGEVIAQGRLQGAVDNFYASPVAGDGKIYFVSLSGKVAVLKPGGSLDVIALGDLDDLCYATPAIADGHIYIRTRGALYSFSESGAVK